MEFVLRRLAMFKFLRTKLTLLFAGLFGVTLILISVAVFSAIAIASYHGFDPPHCAGLGVAHPTICDRRLSELLGVRTRHLILNLRAGTTPLSRACH